MEIRLRYEGNAVFRPAFKPDFEHIMAELHQGDLVRVSKSRSSKQNRLFHGLIQAAFDNQRAGPDFDKWEQLKGWCLVEAGHCFRDEISLEGLPVKDVAKVVGSITASIRRHSEYLRSTYSKSRHALVLEYPKHWRFSRTEHHVACEVLDKVVSIICTDIMPGSSPEDILSMGKARAGLKE